jgi:adenine-specific DNA-methyltransferase
MRYPLFGITPERGQWRWGLERSANAIRNYEELITELAREGISPTPEEIDRWYLRQVTDGDRKPDLLRLSLNGAPEHYVAPTNKKLLSTLWNDIRPNGSRQVEQIFGKRPFDNPKPIALIKRLMQFAGIGSTGIVLDSFAGSGSTAHAVLDYNADDRGHRRFILIESEEYANTITAERVRLILRGIPKAHDQRIRDGMEGSFTYCRLGPSTDVEPARTS